jgi:hypothetical protein
MVLQWVLLTEDVLIYLLGTVLEDLESFGGLPRST